MLRDKRVTSPAWNTAVAPNVTLVFDFPERDTTNTTSITPTIKAMTTDITITVRRRITRSIPGPEPQEETSTRATPLPSDRGQARPGRSRSGSKDHRPRPARRRLRSHLHRSPPDA